MNRNERTKRILFWVIYAGLLLFLSRYDLLFSSYMTSHGNAVLIAWGAHISLLPGSLTMCFSSIVLGRMQEGRNRYLLYTAGFAGCLVGAYHIAGISGQYVYPLTAVTGILIFVLLYRLSERVPQNEMSRKVCLAGILLSVSSITVTSILKVIWGRARFWSLAIEGQEFSYWLDINGPVLLDDMNKSFPSGHTTAASVILWTCLLPYMDSRFAGRECFLIAFSLVWIVLTALARIMAGMHYLSDTMAGFAITLGLFMVITSKLGLDKAQAVAING